MKDIFTDLYNKVLGFFQKQETEKKENAKDVAYNRLKLVLMQDRTNLTPLLLERMRGEMIDVLSKYVEMDKEALELNFEQEGDSMALMLSIPVLRAKEEDEIQAALEEEDKKKAEEAEKEAEEDSESDDEDSQESKETEDEESEENDACESCECKDCKEECELEECKCDSCEFAIEDEDSETDSEGEACDWADGECNSSAQDEESEEEEPKKNKKNKKSKN